MSLPSRKGFTLIELLVVVAIIALLSTMAFLFFANGRKKARDSRRVADINAVIQAMQSAENDGISLAGSCAGTGGPYALNGCAFSPVSSLVDFKFTSLVDPSTSASAVCTSASTAPCIYSIQGPSAGATAPTVSNYVIYFYVEGTGGMVSPGIHKATPGGIN